MSIKKRNYYMGGKKHTVELKYFAKYENGSVFAWNGGRTSWSSEGHATVCELAKLPERSSNEY